jgi:hypothetical protein
MLTLDGLPFTSGRSRFFDQDVEGAESTAKIYVKIHPEGFEGPILAQLDTGSPWSILTAEIADALGLFASPGVATRMRTRLGLIEGHLERIPVVVPADEGASLRIEATVFVCPDWDAGNFIGYSGFIDAIRIGLDPQRNFLYFGSY